MQMTSEQWSFSLFNERLRWYSIIRPFWIPVKGVNSEFLCWVYFFCWNIISIKLNYLSVQFSEEKKAKHSNVLVVYYERGFLAKRINKSSRCTNFLEVWTPSDLFKASSFIRKIIFQLNFVIYHETLERRLNGLSLKTKAKPWTRAVQNLWISGLSNKRSDICPTFQYWPCTRFCPYFTQAWLPRMCS